MTISKANLLKYLDESTIDALKVQRATMMQTETTIQRIIEESKAKKNMQPMELVGQETYLRFCQRVLEKQTQKYWRMMDMALDTVKIKQEEEENEV